MTNSIQDRVQAGAKALDQIIPGWENQIDLGKLDVASPQACVLGQLYGAYCDAPRFLRDNEIALGFYADTVRLIDNMSFEAYYLRARTLSEQVNDEYKNLTACWRELVTHRREEAAAHQELIQQAPEAPTPDFDEVIAQFERDLRRAASFLAAV